MITSWSQKKFFKTVKNSWKCVVRCNYQSRLVIKRNDLKNKKNWMRLKNHFKKKKRKILIKRFLMMRFKLHSILIMLKLAMKNCLGNLVIFRHVKQNVRQINQNEFKISYFLIIQVYLKNIFLKFSIFSSIK